MTAEDQGSDAGSDDGTDGTQDRISQKRFLRMRNRDRTAGKQEAERLTDQSGKAEVTKRSENPDCSTAGICENLDLTWYIYRKSNNKKISMIRRFV